MLPKKESSHGAKGRQVSPTASGVLPQGESERAQCHLDEFKTTGYHRKHAIAVLNGRRERVSYPIRRPRRRVYGAEEADAIATLADLFDNICTKRLRAAMDVELPRLYKAGTLDIRPQCYEKLLVVSPATMDRLRAGCQRRSGKRRGFTNLIACNGFCSRDETKRRSFLP
jgi:hypothetical protein